MLLAFDGRSVSCVVRSYAAIGVSMAALAIAAADPAAAYERGWGFWQNPVVQPDFRMQMQVPRQAPPRMLRSSPTPKGKHIVEKVHPPEKIPAGPLQIIISVKTQRLTLYANGEPIAHSAVATGVPGHPTPFGIFSVIEKQIYHESNIYSSAPMPFMQRITWSGVAMHQGVVPGNRPASHGCIRLPAAFAQRLWGITKVGARVIIAYDEFKPADAGRARLFAQLQPAVADAADTRIKLATAAEPVTDAPLKGSIDPSDRSDEARIERAIDQAVQAGMAAADAAVAADGSFAAAPPEPGKPALIASPKDQMLRPGPISIFISRKLGKLFVRKGMVEVFESPVTIAEANHPLGTYLFTALDAKNDGQLRWNVVSLPTETVVTKGKYSVTIKPNGEKLRTELVAPTYAVTPPGDPQAALDRITIPEKALARIAELMTPGASLIVSDLGQSFETGRGTDFIVLTR